jgi:hypothetical protein
MFWNRNPRQQQSEDFVTLYNGEDIHPTFSAVFPWVKENIWQETAVTKSATTLGYQDIANDVILAGGALRSFFTDTPVRDYDLYFKDQKTLDRYMNGLASIGFQKTNNTTDKSVTYRRGQVRDGQILTHTVNMIRAPFYATASDVIKDYDFTVCMCAVQGDSLVYHPQYFTDLATRSLRIYKPANPLNTVWRVQKYVKLGYSIDRENLWQLFEGIHDIPSLPNVYTIEDQKTDNDAIPITDVLGGS